MGLAISLVAAVPEKVWFCTIKGYKPWLEPDAKNTKTQEQGGQTIWCVQCADVLPVVW
jgi:ATP-dependent RNA helicase DDX1